jgi:hypothetical protein
VGIRNVGHLPARKVRWFIDVTTSSDSRRTHFPIGQLSGNNVIHSGLEMRQWGRTAISRQEFQNFQENNIWVYVWGSIHYDDGFGNERHTNFCHRYDARVLAQCFRNIVATNSAVGSSRDLDGGRDLSPARKRRRLKLNRFLMRLFCPSWLSDAPSIVVELIA